MSSTSEGHINLYVNVHFTAKGLFFNLLMENIVIFSQCFADRYRIHWNCLNVFFKLNFTYARRIQWKFNLQLF